MNAAIAPSPMAGLKCRIVELARRASTEIIPQDAKLAPALADRLPAGTTVYVAHPAAAALEDVVRAALRLEAHGLRASPHFVARRIESERALRAAVRALAEGGVEQALLVAGDADRPAGSYCSTLELLETGVLQEAGLRRLGVAGHPEGHRSIGPSTLWKALQDKQALASRAGLEMHIVTQFGFDPAAVHAWEQHFARHGITLPVHVGMAGPAPPAKLIRYAVACGVNASLRSLVRNRNALRKVSGLAISPDEMLIGIARGSMHARTHIRGMHLFSFGSVMASARWLRAVADGCFEMSSDGSRFETF